MYLEKTQTYFGDLEKNVKLVYAMAEEARSKGFDPSEKVEVPLAKSLAEKVVGLISTIYPQMKDSGISDRILELEKKYNKLDSTVAFKIAEEVSKQKFCKFKNLLEAIDAGIRVGFAYLTLGVVSSPIEGYTGLKIGKTKEGKEYFIANFSGPIRSAGTTASCMVLMLIDYLRELFGYAKYDPTLEESKRVYTELLDFHERVTNLQYMPTEEEALFIAKNLPIQIAGDPSEKLEVSNYKNLERVNTNFLRSGFCLIIGEGLAQKAAKGFRLLGMVKKNGINCTGFDFLEEYIEMHSRRDKGKSDDSPTYINDLVAGRPVFGHPSKSGSFRFRYGRSRISGFSAAGVHPATMAITDSFLATGTQLKVEKPTKGCVVTPCDSIDGPIVKLFSGSVKKLKTRDQAEEIYPDVEEIIYLGDILFPFSDLNNRNYPLVNPGYVEEWWHLELEKADFDFAKTINPFKLSLEEAKNISKKYSLPLNPNFIFYWKEISNDEFLGLVNWLKNSRFDGKLILPYNEESQEKFKLGKRALELLGVEHEVSIESVIVSEQDAKTLFANLGVDFEDSGKEVLLDDFVTFGNYILDKPVLEIINSLSEFEIKDKSGEFVGARMGRPEKAKLRKLVGSPNVLFPVGQEGGRLRSVNAAYEHGKVKSSFPLHFCQTCNKETIYPRCSVCGLKTRKKYFCYECKEKSFERCSEHEKSFQFLTQEIDMGDYFNNAVKQLGLRRDEVPALIKGVRGTSSAEHKIENLAKGILRATFDLQVNKDGTIRFDATELPLVAFKAKEISVSVEKLKELGYAEDIFGQELVNEEQILELQPHDVILPSPKKTLDERGDDVFMRMCNFIDSLLVRFYEMKPFYNIKTREDLVGHLGVCMAPHNCAGVICRFIGFSESQGLFASPYMHAAIRRDCDGDEAAVMLLTDVLLNFSLEFLPRHRGGTQDAPLVLNTKIDAGEVDDQILDFETLMKYPLELYEKAVEKKGPSEVDVKDIRKVLKLGEDPFVNLGYTHGVSDFNMGVPCSSYKSLGTMKEKVDHQMGLVEKIRSADTADTARLILEKHFIRDIRGNLRRFSTQQFRCVGCNESLRRPPLTGICPVCRGKIIFTINEGGIKKYLEPALDLASKYNLSIYMKQNLELIKRHIESVFGREKEKQEALQKWF
ncbi:MAG: DNA polymerase II large subunit [Candidatus Pacearchaeota archaeon]